MSDFKQLTWEDLDGAVSVDDKTAVFHVKLDTLLSGHFVWKRMRRKSSSLPWLTDGLKSLMKQRMSIFREEGRFTRWKRVDSSIKMLEIRKTR